MKAFFGLTLSFLALANADLFPDLGIPPVQTVFDPFCIRLPPLPLIAVNPSFNVSIENKTDQFKVSKVQTADESIKKLVKDGFLAKGRQVVFLIHGWFGNLGPGWMLDLKDALNEKENSTIIMVFWSIAADIPEYGITASTTRTVATAVAAVAEAISKSSVFKDNPADLYMHCVGHSLGAHICGQAGRKAKDSKGKPLFDRVTGLDPSGPGFEICTDNLNINKESADCVDVIHTDGSVKSHTLPLFYYGTLKSWGHIDFYPNGGTNQPACSGVPVINDGLCNHLTVVEYFIESVKFRNACEAEGPCPKVEESRSCQNETQYMGYYSTCHRDSEQRLEGSYYVRVDGQPQCKTKGLGYIDLLKGTTY